jgi:hypothetical protein
VGNRVLRGPVYAAADIAAQLRLVVYAMDVGLRDDGSERAAMVEPVERLDGPVAPHLRLPAQFTWDLWLLLLRRNPGADPAHESAIRSSVLSGAW